MPLSIETTGVGLRMNRSRLAGGSFPESVLGQCASRRRSTRSDC
jgi:hypothetical protein